LKEVIEKTFAIKKLATKPNDKNRANLHTIITVFETFDIASNEGKAKSAALVVPN
jgi:hypothetical protein